MNTVLTNRLGDSFLFIFFRTIFFSSSFLFYSIFFSPTMIFFLILTSFTKRAQFPFSGWLPKAIRAPTPVRSLVHRRTLVTAGLILLFNFKFIILFFKFSSLILNIGCLTIIFSRITALIEEDLKKVVALRTLSQIGFSITTLRLGLNFLSFLHLIRHALFKRCLFIQVGFIIHNSFNQQDGRFYQNNGNMTIFIQLQITITLFCLCGLFFRSGSVRKDFILESFFFNNNNFLFLLTFSFSIFLTFGYRWRLWKRLLKSFPRTLKIENTSKIYNLNTLPLSIFSLILLWWINLNLINIPSFFNYLDFFFPILLLFLFFILLIYYFKNVIRNKILSYKFSVDFYPKSLQQYLTNLKFNDLFLNKTTLYLLKNIIRLRLKNLIFLNFSFLSSFSIFIIFIIFI